MINVLIQLIVAGLVLYVVYWILGQLPMPQPIRTVILVVLGILAILWFLQFFGQAFYIPTL